jgi:hypothetical protein
MPHIARDIQRINNCLISIGEYRKPVVISIDTLRNAPARTVASVFAHQPFESLARRGLIENFQEMLISFPIHAHERLIEQNLFGQPSGGVDNEIRTRLAVRLRGTINHGADVFADAQIDRTSRSWNMSRHVKMSFAPG